MEVLIKKTGNSVSQKYFSSPELDVGSDIWLPHPTSHIPLPKSPSHISIQHPHLTSLSRIPLPQPLPLYPSHIPNPLPTSPSPIPVRHPSSPISHPHPTSPSSSQSGQKYFFKKKDETCVHKSKQQIKYISISQWEAKKNLKKRRR